MPDPRGFLTIPRENPSRRPVDLRLQDWREVYAEFGPDKVAHQAGRCMDCGIPFCHKGCPLGNLIPEWNDLMWRHDPAAAADRLHATNNFPEFTGRLCPAPCEAACVLGIGDDPVSIKQVEVTIADTAFAEGYAGPVLPRRVTGKRVAVVGSGPAGLAAAQQLTRAGHTVTVYERADAIGGLLRYGIPEFKMEKAVLDRRLTQMRAEGTEFRAGVDVGRDLPVAQLRVDHDAVVLAGGATVGRDLPVPGRELDGIHLAMEYLPHGNRAALDPSYVPPIDARGRHVVIIGGGDTGADCLGTAHRQHAASVTQLEIMPLPPDHRVAERNPWPTWPMVYRTSSAHEEGGERVFSVSTQRFVGDAQGHVRGLVLTEVDERFQPIAGTERELPCDLALLAMGFTGPQREGLLEELGVDLDERGNVARDGGWMSSVEGVFAAGDMGRGQSLIVWAIAEGRSCAAAVDAWLMGETALPSPVRPTDRPL